MTRSWSCMVYRKSASFPARLAPITHERGDADRVLLRANAARVERAVVEDLDALQVTEELETLETGRLFPVAGDLAGLASGAVELGRFVAVGGDAGGGGERADGARAGAGSGADGGDGAAAAARARTENTAFIIFVERCVGLKTTGKVSENCGMRCIGQRTWLVLNISDFRIVSSGLS